MTPIPPTVSFAIDDPISADVQAVCATIQSVCTFACTTQGQALIAESIKNAQGFRQSITDGWNGLLKIFRRAKT